MSTRRPAGWISALLVVTGTLVAVAATSTAPADAASYPGQIAFADGYNGLFRTQVGSGGAEAVVAQSATSPSWSPDGTQLAYLKEDDHSYDLVVDARLGGHPHTLLKADTTSPTLYLGSETAWSPDGTRIAYECDLAYQSPDGQHAFGGQLCVYDVDTKKHTEVTDTADRYLFDDATGGRLSWSADSRYVLATVGHTVDCDVEAPPGTYCSQPDVGRITMATGAIQLLTDDTAYDASYSPDGKQIVYYDPVSDAGEPTGVVVAGSGGAHPLSIASMDEVHGAAITVYPSPTWSPDGELVLFSAEGIGDDPDTRDRYANLFSVKADGTGPFKQLTSHLNNVYDAVWTPVLTTCTVPNLKGKNLAQAKTLLTKAACALGRVTGPGKHRDRLHVRTQSLKANTERPAGTKVGVRLG